MLQTGAPQAGAQLLVPAGLGHGLAPDPGPRPATSQETRGLGAGGRPRAALPLPLPGGLTAQAENDGRAPDACEAGDEGGVALAAEGVRGGALQGRLGQGGPAACDQQGE